jgi:hypothetical protein
LKDHLVSILRAQLSGFQLKNIPLEFILTVPAVWSEAAKEKTLLAAEEAGLGDDAPIHMISEPVGLVSIRDQGYIYLFLAGSRSNTCSP